MFPGWLFTGFTWRLAHFDFTIEWMSTNQSMHVRSYINLMRPRHNWTRKHFGCG